MGINRFKEAFLVHYCTKNLDIRQDNLQFCCLYRIKNCTLKSAMQF